MYGNDIAGFIGGSKFLLSSGNPGTPDGLWEFAYWLFQVVFAATAATIVSGAMAERTKFTAYLIYSLAISAAIYPISGHWIWGGGWISKLGFVDFAGSTVVHSVGDGGGAIFLLGEGGWGGGGVPTRNRKIHSRRKTQGKPGSIIYL
jgi:Amt family ammonium transporter